MVIERMKMTILLEFNIMLMGKYNPTVRKQDVALEVPESSLFDSDIHDISLEN